MDPYAVLGLTPDAGADEIARAYRELAKRHHPDRPGGGVEPMAAINDAYALLRDPLARTRARARTRTVGRPESDLRPAAGAWLEPAVRLALGMELVRALAPGEPVLLVTDAVTWDGGDVRLAVTDRRLLWLRDDALGDRVRWVRLDRPVAVSARLRGRRRRSGELRLEPRDGPRHTFAGLRPEALVALARMVGADLRTVR